MDLRRGGKKALCDPIGAREPRLAECFDFPFDVIFDAANRECGGVAQGIIRSCQSRPPDAPCTKRARSLVGSFVGQFGECSLSSSVITQTLGELPLSSFQHEMRRVLGRLVFGHGKSKSGQVKTGKQCFSLAEHNRPKCKVQGIY